MTTALEDFRVITGRFTLPLAFMLSSCFAPPARLSVGDQSPKKGSQSTNEDPDAKDSLSSNDSKGDKETNSGTDGTTKVPSGDTGTEPIPNPSGKTGPDCVNWETISDPSEVVCAGSAANVISGMPDWLKAYFTLMLNTKSNQVTAPGHPRLIVFSPTGNVVVASGTTPGSNSVEIIVFDHKNEEWKFGEVDFSKGASAKISSAGCEKCHGKPFHIIWGDYKNWGDTIYDLSAESAAMLTAAAKGDTSTPEVIRKLKLAKSYEEGDGSGGFVQPFNSGWEVNMGLNIIQNNKASRTVVAKLFANPMVTKAQKLNLAVAGICPSSNKVDSILKGLGIDPNIYMNPTLLTDNLGYSDGRTNDGMVYQEAHVSAHILNRLFAEDATLRSAYPDLYALFQKPAAKAFFSTSTQEILKTGQDVNSARAFLWKSGIEGYLDKNPEVCKSLSAMK
jgi:hypothetical protein